MTLTAGDQASAAAARMHCDARPVSRIHMFSSSINPTDQEKRIAVFRSWHGLHYTPSFPFLRSLRARASPASPCCTNGRLLERGGEMDGDVGRENKVVGSFAKTDGSSGVGQGPKPVRHHGTARGDLDERDKWRNSRKAGRRTRGRTWLESMIHW